MANLDQLIITVSGDGYNVQAMADGKVVAERTAELSGDSIELNGDDLFETMPIDLALTLDAMDLMLLDAVIALMPDRHALPPLEG